MNNHHIVDRNYEVLENGYDVISYGESMFESFNCHEELHREITKLFTEDAINTWGKNLISNIIYDNAYGGILNYFMSGIKQQEYGEVFTPKWLVNEILDKFEKHDPDFFKNPKHTVIDFAAGVGNLLVEVIDRFYKGTRSLYDSDEECMKHILEHQIYAVEIQPNNYMILCKALDVNNLCPDNPHFVCADADGFDFWDIDYFDMIFINPPYSKTVISDITGKTVFIDLYQKFSKMAYNISKRYVLNIIPAKSIYKKNDFSKELIYNHNIVNLTTFFNYKDCFNATVSGGVIYYILDKKYNNRYNLPVEEIGYNKKRISGIRNVYDYDGIYPKTLTGCNIIKKLKNGGCTKFFSDVVFPTNIFKLSSNYKSDNISFKNDEYYKVLCSNKNVEYVNKNDVNTKYNDVIDKYKFVICYASSAHGLTPNNNGKIKVILSPQIIDKEVLFTQTYLCLYVNDDLNVMKNVESYFSTKPVQYLLLQGMSNHHICKTNFCFVPVVDFNEPWTNERFYTEFNLTDEEIEEIESMVM